MTAVDQLVLRCRRRIGNEFKMSGPGCSCKLARFRLSIVTGLEYFRRKTTFIWTLT